MLAIPIPSQDIARLRTLRGQGAPDTSPEAAFAEWEMLRTDFQHKVKQLLQIAARLDNLATGVEQGKGTAGKLPAVIALADEAQTLLLRACDAMGGLRGGVGTNLHAPASNTPKGAEHRPELASPLPTNRTIGGQEFQSSAVAERFEKTTSGAPMNTTMKTEKKRILVVDDRARDTQLVKLCLEMTNDYEVREENDAEAALSTAEAFQPQLILLDIMMPGIDGGRLAACFQSNPKLRSVPIVFLTALVTKGEVEAGGGQVGDYPFLAKPISPSELVACLRRQLGG